MLYRALVGLQKIETFEKSKKSEREEAQIQLMQEQMKFWNSSESVVPYYDPSYDIDSAYSSVLRKNQSLPKDVNVDDPASVMNFLGKSQGRIFYKNIPTNDKKMRELKRKEWTKLQAKYEANEEEIPANLVAKYEYETMEPEPSPKTQLYAYSTLNPNGMFASYNYPITQSYIPDIKDIEASKLLNRNYGTMHDIVQLGDLDFDGTYLPHVVFRNDGEMLESYPELIDGCLDPGGDPDEIKNFLEETLDRKDYVAIIECEA